MPYKNRTCGIYKISTPNGSVYVGSSTRIEGRWSDHRGALGRGTHRSARLQAAFNKHGSALCYEIIETCISDDLNEREQFWIDTLGAELNTTVFVNNVWANPETRAKLAAVHTSTEWRAARSEIGNRRTHRWKEVDCENGTRFSTMTAAADFAGVKPSGMHHLVKTQRASEKCGLRFKYATDEWAPVPLSISETKSIAIRAHFAKKRAVAA